MTINDVLKTLYPPTFARMDWRRRSRVRRAWAWLWWSSALAWTIREILCQAEHPTGWCSWRCRWGRP